MMMVLKATTTFTFACLVAYVASTESDIDAAVTLQYVKDAALEGRAEGGQCSMAEKSVDGSFMQLTFVEAMGKEKVGTVAEHDSDREKDELVHSEENVGTVAEHGSDREEDELVHSEEKVGTVAEHSSDREEDELVHSEDVDVPMAENRAAQNLSKEMRAKTQAPAGYNEFWKQDAGYNEFWKQDCPGNNIQVLTGDEQFCADACSGMPSCKGFSHNNDMACIPKSATCTNPRSSSWSFYVKAPTATTTASPSSSPTPSPTSSPTASPTSAPTATPTVSARGDPHLVNVHGQRFDLMQPGNFTMLHVPRYAEAGGTLLRVDASVENVGGACMDMYIKFLNFTGMWVKPTGTEFFATRPGISSWMQFHKVALKVVWGHTSGGVKYMNLLARNTANCGYTVGGLLGEDDHTAVATPSKDCNKRTLSLVAQSNATR